jgi:outer membrane protein TolC
MVILFKRVLLAPISAALLTGCASTKDLSLLENRTNGFQEVSVRTVAATGKNPLWIMTQEQAQIAADRSRRLLGGKVVRAETAVQVALLNNKGLQAALAEIGLSSADVWQEHMLVNPIVSIGTGEEAGVRIFETAIVGNLLALITREKRVAIASVKFREAQYVAAEKTLRLAFDTERAWTKAVASRETITYLEKAQTASDATSDLAKELGRTGAFNKAVQAREHAAYAEITGQLAEARITEQSAREELNRLMGVWGKDISYRLPSALPRLPSKIAVRSNVEQMALRSRVDLKIAKSELEAVARSYKLTDATRYLTDLEILAGAEFEKPKGGDTELAKKRMELEFAIPIFDSGKARVRKAEFEYMQAANKLAEKAVNIRSEARGAYDKYRSSYEVARHYRDKVVPLRETISQESLLEYNGMIASTFELLSDTRSKINALLVSVNAKQNFWMAEIDFRAAIHGGLGQNGDADSIASLAGAGGAGH